MGLGGGGAVMLADGGPGGALSASAIIGGFVVTPGSAITLNWPCNMSIGHELYDVHALFDIELKS